jgi:hypothetical protein
MPGFLLNDASVILCKHSGMAKALVADPRVRVDGQPVATQFSPYSVMGCVNPSNVLCISAMWMTAATRVKAGGLPVLLEDSQAVCVPTATGVDVLLTQQRVRGI